MGCFMYSRTNGTNTDRVMISWRILSWGRDIVVYPMRLAGTWTRYSNSAIPHDTSAATIHGLSRRSLRCAYQAMVMKTFDTTSRPLACATTVQFTCVSAFFVRCLDYRLALRLLLRRP